MDYFFIYFAIVLAFLCSGVFSVEQQISYQRRFQFQIPRRTSDIIGSSEDVDDVEIGIPVEGGHLPYEYYETGNPLYNFGYSQSCDRNSCTPPTGDLLIGRSTNLSATSTCGLIRPEKYCILTPIVDNQGNKKQKCAYCDSRGGVYKSPGRYHRIENVVDKPGEDYRLYWWQAENGVQDVSIRFDLEAEFHVTHVIMIFKTFRPAAMLIERSKDNGKTWKVYQYFSSRCEEDFPGVPRGPRVRLSDVICESQYSSELPSYHGEVIFKVLPPDIKADIGNPYSDEVQDLLKVTNLRINFTRLHTFGDNLLDPRKEIRQKYFYALMSMKIRGSCSCNGHASRCVPGDISLAQRVESGMVFDKCECNHNTKPPNCDKCEDLYWDAGWNPSIGNKINECKKCNCNNHANKCRFDLDTWIQSGNRSGGICEECRDNTAGTHCEKCLPRFYRDPLRRLEDPSVCAPCDCDPSGSTKDGICESTEDSTTSGQCHCKRNVGGRRCDQCKPGFWNLDSRNPDGCKACSCSVNGTLDNRGCNPKTGECLCKPNVVGRDCNQCAPNYWGLNPIVDGCKPCDCDPGGSLESQCSPITGECRCKPHIIGRKCDQIEQSFFAPSLDYQTYDAEDANPSKEVQKMFQAPYLGRPPTWTGDGYMRIFPGSSLEFDVNNLPKTMRYEIVVRHMPPDLEWPKVEIRIDPLSSTLAPSSVCLKFSDSFSMSRKTVTLDPGRTYTRISDKPYCFEQNSRYRIRVFTEKLYPGTSNISLLVDSIVLLPVFEDMELFKSGTEGERLYQEFRRYSCGEVFVTLLRPQTLDVCRKIYRAISLMMYNGAIACKCNEMGSQSSICDPDGGACSCKPNVIGRTCDRCAPQHFGLGPDGCKPCDCHSTGSLDSSCDPITGQCSCANNTFGRGCNDCQPGFWNYPYCQRCNCNGHAETCNPKTGICINCLDETGGDHCERCADGYYGNPLKEFNVPCKPCPCPDVPGSSAFHATSCEYDPIDQVPRCLCKPGYTGDRCDRCADNFYGNPSIRGGECKPCTCNNNIDPSSSGNCDPSTGQCLGCLFNTEGDHCEVCKKGFYGNALKQQCMECVCSRIGTNMTIGYCNQETGECPCLSNVIGRECDKCKPNHFNLTSGKGCEPCECDPQGSVNLRCNEFDGQCSCSPTHGGRRCNECQPNYYGDPRIQCFPCECNTLGSLSMQCSKVDGSCQCIRGISGKKCDQCARGYLGTAPRCESCGECFENWDAIIQQLRNDTIRLMDTAKKIQQTGAPGAYKDSFMKIENQLIELNMALSGVNSSETDIDAIKREVDVLRRSLNDIQDALKKADDQIQSTVQRNTQANFKISDLQRQAKELEIQNNQLRENATKLKADDVGGAYNLTQEAYRASYTAQQKVELAMANVSLSQDIRRKAERLLASNLAEFDVGSAASKRLDSFSAKISALEEGLPYIRQLVCGGNNKSKEVCDVQCGGPGCSKCGDIGCNSSVIHASDAENFLTRTGGRLKELLFITDNRLSEMRQAKERSQEAEEAAREAYNKAMRAKNESESMGMEIQNLFTMIDNFLTSNTAKPSEIRTMAEQCLSIKILLTPEQITDLALKINSTLKNIQNIDVILDETENDLNAAEMLEQTANATKARADEVLNIARQVIEALDMAERTQRKAKDAISNAYARTDAASGDLAEIRDHTNHIAENSKTYAQIIDELRNRLKKVQNLYTDFAYVVNRASDEAGKAGDMARDVEKSVKLLEEKYDEARMNLENKERQSGEVRERSENLKQRAEKLAKDAHDKIYLLQSVEDEFIENEKKLNKYSEEIDLLNAEALRYLNIIEERSNFHKTCQN